MGYGPVKFLRRLGRSRGLLDGSFKEAPVNASNHWVSLETWFRRLLRAGSENEISKPKSGVRR